MIESSTSSSPSEIPKSVAELDQNTPPPNHEEETNMKPKSPIPNKSGAPDRIIVPKAFKYPERYTSPTDKMMSPVSRGILARNRKGRRPLPPSAAANQLSFSLKS
ncbi:uncharacterized protein LOC127241997 [Andrographis paniculata]|uniref:uncharacterized protein LOC127241997 n=1 Tax=Andrographis paniculata TaxID=175694 RepID=UPI0021E7120C|nr:uncharacterized protein LOC127241997 [Andrographis paniculata]